MSDTNDKNNPPFNDPMSWKSIGFFSAEDYLQYIFKKTEKITSAIYMISGLLKDSEPLKWELREHGVELLNSSFTASSSLPVDRNFVVQSLFTAALETISLLNIARTSNLISPMNHSVLVREIDQVLALLRDRLAENAENAGLVLSESFFKTPDLFNKDFRTNTPSYTNKTPTSYSSLSRTVSPVKPLKDGTVQGQSGVKVKKSLRQENILSMLKGQSNLTIKDFSNVMKDCSEKTIQRELIDLVKSGLVKKEGERRWSKYSLNS